MMPLQIPRDADLRKAVGHHLASQFHELAAIKHKLADLARSGKRETSNWHTLIDYRESTRNIVGSLLVHHLDNRDSEWISNNEEASRKFGELYRSLSVIEVPEDYDFELEDKDLFDWFGIE